MSTIGLTHEAMRACRTKEGPFDLTIARLELNQILVSRSVQHYMPQRFTHVDFSGMTIRDAKVPYLLLAAVTHPSEPLLSGSSLEPAGRVYDVA